MSNLDELKKSSQELNKSVASIQKTLDSLRARQNENLSKPKNQKTKISPESMPKKTPVSTGLSESSKSGAAASSSGQKKKPRKLERRS